MTRRARVVSPLVVSLLAAGPAAGVDVGPIVRHAADAQRARELAAHPLGFERLEVETELDASGRPDRAERRRYAVLTRGAAEVRRELLEVDGRAPTDAEREKHRRADEKRRSRRSPPGAPSRDEDELRSGRLPLSDLLERLDFRLAGEEVVDGRPCYVVEFGPRESAPSRSLRDRVLGSFAGRAWIDVADREIRRIDGSLTKPVNVLGGAALALKSIRIVYEGQKVLADLWAPCREEIRISATAGLVFDVEREIRFEFSRFWSESLEAPLQAAR